MWRKRAQYRGEGSVGGYLRQIAYRTYLNARPKIERNRKQLGVDRSEIVPSAGDSQDAAGTARRLDEQTLIDRVRRVVNDLPEGWREVFVLFRFEGLTCQEVADTLGLTPKAVERRLTRALRAVTRRVRGKGGAAGADRATRAEASIPAPRVFE